MLGTLLVGVLLYGLLWVFERKRVELDAFNVFAAVIVPSLVVFLLQFGLSFLDVGVVWGLVAPLLFYLVTFIMLWKVVEVTTGRSATYTVFVLVAQLAFGFLLAG